MKLLPEQCRGINLIFQVGICCISALPGRDGSYTPGLGVELVLFKKTVLLSVVVSPGIQLQSRDVTAQLSMDPNFLLN